MKPKNCLIFGASGLVGRNLIRKLTSNNFKVTAVTRNLHQKGYLLKTQGNPGYVDIVEINIFDESKIRNLVSSADICINLIGILYQKGKLNTFENIHEKIPKLLSELCEKNNVKQFIHLSALGIEEAKDSLYAKSKLNGEIEVKRNYKNATILRPSVIYSVDDNFTNNFMQLLSLLPIFPLYHKGATLFRPIHVLDLTEIIYKVILNNIRSEIIECIGQEEMSLKNIIQKLSKLIEKERTLISIPLPLAKLSAYFFEFFPKPLLTNDQLRLLKYHNLPSGKYKTNFDLNFLSKSNFEEEVKKYCYTWKEEGQFSQSKYKIDNF